MASPSDSNIVTLFQAERASESALVGRWVRQLGRSARESRPPQRRTLPLHASPSGRASAVKVPRLFGGGAERRRSPRTRCRLPCRVRIGRRRFRARVLDISDGGLCVLSPIKLEAKQDALVVIDVPEKGPVEVEVTAWHVRRVKAGSPGVKAWSIGMMVRKAGDGFETLLPSANMEFDADFAAEEGSPAALQPEEAPRVISELELEEDSLSAEELDDLDLELLSTSELDDLILQCHQNSDAEFQMFRVRVKAATGPRTRTLTLGAASADEAQALAREDLGEDWRVIEVTAT